MLYLRVVYVAVSKREPVLGLSVDKGHYFAAVRYLRGEADITRKWMILNDEKKTVYGEKIPDVQTIFGQAHGGTKRSRRGVAKSQSWEAVTPVPYLLAFVKMPV